VVAWHVSLVLCGRDLANPHFIGLWGELVERRGATLTLVAPASESPLAFIVVAASRRSLLHASNHTDRRMVFA
jgi:hypothetical protein